MLLQLWMRFCCVSSSSLCLRLQALLYAPPSIPESVLSLLPLPFLFRFSEFTYHRTYHTIAIALLACPIYPVSVLGLWGPQTVLVSSCSMMALSNKPKYWSLLGHSGANPKWDRERITSTISNDQCHKPKSSGVSLSLLDCKWSKKPLRSVTCVEEGIYFMLSTEFSQS